MSGVRKEAFFIATWRPHCKAFLHELHETLSLRSLATSYRSNQEGAIQMKRQHRTKLLIDVGREEALALAAQIEAAYCVKDIQPAREGLVMVKMRESSHQSLFFIGEVLITEAKVQIDEHFGIGLVREYEPQLARALAIIDAAYNAQLAETNAWQSCFEQLEQRLLEQQQRTKRSIERTKVNFNTMI